MRLNTEPADLRREDLVSALRAWELDVASIRYLPVGAGSHHYLAVDSAKRRWFVTVDELIVKLFGMFGPTFSPWHEPDLDAAFSVLDRAFRTALALRESGLEFVHAPVAQPNGDVLTRVGDCAMSLFPFIEDVSRDDDDGRHRVLAALGRLHTATDGVPAGLPQRDPLTVPLQQQFLEWLDDLRSPWTSGPYGEAARLLLQPREDAIRNLLARCDELAEAVRAAGKPWVVTHGQMHSGNLVCTRDDALLLVDWDCVAVAPRERDLGTWNNGLDPKSEDDWSAYTSSGQPRDIDPTATELYRLIGLLWCICTDTYVFRKPHDDNADARHEWRNLQTALAELDR